MRALASLLFLGPLAGCVLLVPDYEPGAHCTFAGETECAKCMRAECQPKIDACCGVETCREAGYGTFYSTTGTTMGAVDECGNGSTRCSSLLGGARKTTEGDEVRTCIESKCRTECAPGVLAAQFSCDAPRTQTTDCAKCIYGSCGDRLTACCAEASGCQDGYVNAARDVAECMAGDERACANRVRTGSPNGSAGALRRCIDDACEEACLGDRAEHRTCALTKGGRYCTCSASAASGGGECSPVSTDGGSCFETADGGCLCGHFACTYKRTFPNPTCKCTFDNDAEGGPNAERCNWEELEVFDLTPDDKCCLTETSFGIECECKTVSSCPSGREVERCDRDHLFATLKRPAGNVCSQ
ncbi:MAG: hypothetical protein KIT84_32795 [Labilithrix sp.]|nr:hypothetical protein [Labilithrix sp.]MCW5815854.1 hypothetical protein [Labilithrix sp.]